MNGITLIQPQTPLTQHQNDDNNARSSSLTIFKSILAKIQFGMDQITEGTTGQENSELYALIAQLVSELSIEEQQMNEELLSTPFAEELLNQLPVELQLEIEDVLSENSNIENFIGDGQNLKNPLHLTVLAMKMSQFINRDFNQNKQNGFENVVLKLLGQLKAILSENKQLVQSFQDPKSKLKRQEFVLTTFSRVAASNEMPASQVGVPTIQGQPLNQIHQFLLHVGESRGEHQNGEQLLRQFKNILERSSLLQFPNGLNKLTIKLFPQHLGRLDVTLTQHDGVMIAQLMTTTKAAKNAIESQIQLLRQAFLSQNIQVEKIEVFTQQQQSLVQPDKQNQEEKNSSHENKQPKEQEDGDEKVNFQDFLNETFNVEV